MLRWHAQVRTQNGAITSYVRIKADNASQAVQRAQRTAWRRHKNTPLDGRLYRLRDWHVIFVGLHEPDMNKL